MGIVAILWLGVWGGMFTDLSDIKSPRAFDSFFNFFQTARAVLPFFAIFICVVLLMALRSRFVLSKTSLGYLFLYCFIGFVATLLVSPSKEISLYWTGMYLSPLLVSWVAENAEDPLGQITKLMNVNFFACLVVLAMTLPQTLQLVRGHAPYSQFFELPFGLGQMRVNGVGRFALIVAVFAFVRFVYNKNILRYFWAFCLFLSLLTLLYTRSRTSLLGLAVVSLLYVLIQGLNLRFLLVGPSAAYILWISGYKWRAQENLENLFNLTGRDYTWERGIDQIMRSPLFGWGFQADRLMLDSEHMHNSYLHSMIQSGIIGGLLFIAAIISVWAVVIKKKLLQRVKFASDKEKMHLLASILLLGFLTSRSFFESTAAFYGVDLLVLLPAISYIFAWVHSHPLETGSLVMKRWKW
jgi:hypothetical protein